MDHAVNYEMKGNVSLLNFHIHTW